MPSSQTLFFLGATGYIGSQFLLSSKSDAEVYAQLKEYTILALVRDTENSKAKALQALWPGVVLVKGSLDDTSVIEEYAQKSDFTFNAANSDHEPSIKAIISGLQKRSANQSADEKLPLYIHISGLAILSDNTRGEFVPDEKQIRYPDTKFNLNLTPSTNLHHAADRLIYAAGTQKENPIRTILTYPGVVYGFGDGIAQLTPLYRIFANLYIKLGSPGTWGPGHNKLGVIHVKDVASAYVAIFKQVFEGKAKEGTEGFYFITDINAEPLVWNKFAGEVGKSLFAEGLIKDTEVKPAPEEITSSLGEFGWSLAGGNWAGGIAERLNELGWEPVETKKLGFWQSLPSEVGLFIDEKRKGVTDWGRFTEGLA